SGGAYVVAKDNLGTLPSLVAAAALLTDYILTVAVSVAAGVFAITSAAPSLGHLKVELSLLFIVLLTVANLRGVKEAGILVAMPVIAITLFIGVSFLAVQMHARPSGSVSVLSEIARATFPTGSAGSFLFYVIQVLTFAILVLAANTSFQGFPRLGALLARDRFFPRQFVNLGDRLVYSNGILVLSGVAAALILVFRANVDSLIHLYVVGVFTAFTLSQAGMVRYWHRRGQPGWERRAILN